MMSPVSIDHSSSSNPAHLAFLRRMAEDVEFRTELEADPRAALAEMGLSVAADDIPGHVALPSRETVQMYLKEVDEDVSRPPWHWLLG